MSVTETVTKKKQRSPHGRHPNSRKNLITFKPGQSGNPKGRPLGSLNRATVFQRILDLPTPVETPDGTKQTVTLYEAMALGQAKSAIQGNTRAFIEVQDTLHGKMADKIQISPDTQQIAQEVAERLIAEGFAKEEVVVEVLKRYPDAELDI